MYMDYVLFAVGGALLLAAIILGIMLFRSRKRGQDYRRVLAEETERIDVISTLRSTQALNYTVKAAQSTSPLVTERLTQPLCVQEVTEPLGPIKANVTVPLAQNNQASGGARNNRSDAYSEATHLDFDFSALEGKYEILREIHGGGMSRIFLARHAKLGNEWIIKYVDGKNTELANEAEVLKKLNHINLPQIIDIFQDAHGTFLVERYIEGCSLEEALQLRDSIKEGQICEWGLQLAQVLSYLHNLETPIIHCDLKPSNLMITHDDKLVLIDFGISKRQGISDKAIGITLRYAAPEQFQGRARSNSAVRERFGGLPPEQETWGIDERTDLYSVGVILFELLTGSIPTPANIKDIHSFATPKMAEVVSKCLNLQPERRYQTADELVEALEGVQGQRVSMARSLVLRRVAVACFSAALLGGIASTASATYINRMENLSIVDMAPGKALVTAQQSVQVLLQKVRPNGEVVMLEPDQVQWSYSEDNIARLDGDRLVGLNVGQTTLYGQYRNKMISLDITVSEPVQELVDIALRYPDDTSVAVYAGSGQREQQDGGLANCAFVSPEYLSADGDTVYVSDSGVIRVIEDGEVSTIPLEPDFLTSDRVRSRDGALYILTGPWEADDGIGYYGFLCIRDESAEFLYYTEAAWSTISDFAFSSDGTLWFVQQNLGTGQTGLCTLDIENYESRWVMDLPDGASRMVFDEADTLYISVPDSGIILRVGSGESEWSYFAGVEGERNFIDGAIPNFYHPTSIAVRGNELYVLDFDTVRVITVEGSGALYTETIAGVPVADTNPSVVLGEGCDAVLAASDLASLTFDGAGRLLLSDPKNSAIYQIK